MPSYAPVKQSEKQPVAVAIGSGGTGDSAQAEILASGRGHLAESILEIAFTHGVKVREDAPLATVLTELDLNTPIPSEAILAVAEILAKVYEANTTLPTPTALPREPKGLP